MDGTTKSVILHPVKFCASAKINLLLIAALLSQGSILAIDSKNNIVVSIDNQKVSMGRWIKAQDGGVSGVDIHADTGCTVFYITQSPNTNCKRYIKVNLLHELLGHPSKATTRMMAKEWMRWQQIFFNHAKPVLWEKLRKQTCPWQSINDEIFLESRCLLILFTNCKNVGGKKHWLLIIDDYTAYTSLFLRKTVSFQTKSVSWWKNWRQNITLKLKRFVVIMQMRIVLLGHCSKKKEMELLLNKQYTSEKWQHWG